MKISFKFTSLLMMALFGMATVFTSCGDDEVDGCTDSTAENFNSAATSDDGSCTYARDKFLGNYFGALACPGALAVISTDSLDYDVAEAVGGDVNSVAITINNLAVTINGTISGDQISLSNTIPGYPYDLNGDGVPDLSVDLVVTGDATLVGDVMNGTLNIDAYAEGTAGTGMPLAADVCALNGTRQ